MHQPEKRAEPRILVSCRGTLILGDMSAPCHIQNMCSRGFLIKHTKELPVGQILQLKVELDSARHVECTVQVRHVNRDCLGAKVIEMSEEGKIFCQQFLEERRGTQTKSVAQV